MNNLELHRINDLPIVEVEQSANFIPIVRTNANLFTYISWLTLTILSKAPVSSLPVLAQVLNVVTVFCRKFRISNKVYTGPFYSSALKAMHG